VNELVEKLMDLQSVSVAKPEDNKELFGECLKREYFHILFPSTGTELGVRLDSENSIFNPENFSEAESIHLEGYLTLNFEKVKCVVDLDTTTLNGKGFLVPCD
jgi:hypothetical protein